MKLKLILILFAVIFSAAALYTVASTDDSRMSARGQWLPKQQVEAHLTQMGYRVQRLEANDGCLEVYVTDKDGARSELYVDPTTGTPGCRGENGDRDD